MEIVSELELKETGIPELDLQHKLYINYFLQIREVLSGSENNLSIPDILDELTLFTNFHFKSEENLMKRFGYPEIEKHKKVHKVLADRLFLETCKIRESMMDTEELMDFLVNWFIEHTQGEDYKLGEFLRDKHKSLIEAEINYKTWPA